MINQKQEQQLGRRHSSLLELEAAEYFKLEPAQVCMFAPASTTSSSRKQQHHLNRSPPTKTTSDPQPPVSSCQRQQKQHKRQPSTSLKNLGNLQETKAAEESKNTRIKSGDLGQAPKAVTSSSSSPRILLATPTQLVATSSTTSSSNSLPSVSSSASVSPSLVCPHLTLDHILAGEPLKGGLNSPHTIGLCRECQLNAPANIHSPLSPAFSPSKGSRSPTQYSREQKEPEPECELSKEPRLHPSMRRFHSDYQMSNSSTPSRRAQATRRRLQLETRDDSLDYYLDSKEVRKLQLSPTLRHSVEYIRNNFTESGRVLRIHKNGQPYEKALRVCVTRGEFKNITQLLDHINSRLVIALGARFLFHLDGQLVYSVNELKHNSIYIVSGTRTFDFKANSILKEQQRKESIQHKTQHNQVQLKRQSRQKIRSHSSLAPLSISHRCHRSEQEDETFEKQSTDAHNIQVTEPNISDQEQKVRAPTKISQKPAQFQESPIKITHRSSLKQEKQVVGVDEKNQAPKLERTIERFEDEKMSKSEENLNSAMERSEKYANYSNSKRVNLTRAKSEFDGNKRKKNVTFLDTGRGSSPTVPMELVTKQEKVVSPVEEGGKQVDEQTEPEDANIKALNTNEIGIQVSDSLEGFLVDLPIPMPPSKKEAEDGKLDGKKSYLRKGQGALYKKRAGKQQPVKAGSFGRSSQAENAQKQVKKRQIVTISERQLSLEEMNKLKDLDHGYHHSEKSPLDEPKPLVTIKLDHVDEVISETEEQTPEIKMDEHTEKDNKQLADGAEHKENEENYWEYPGGRESHSTPTERPISQSEASESVNARVTTPSPTISSGEGVDRYSLTDSLGERSMSDENERVCLPVKGRLCRGLDPPATNFKLIWVHGFTINNQYPENSNTFIDASFPNSSSASLLSPSPSNQEKQQQPQQSQIRHLFKPNERFHNWINYCRKFDELVYPSGSLVVLWCRSTNEQRFYTKHTSNVSALSLCSANSDLVTSAQFSESGEGSANSSIHLWSLSKLQLLQLIDEDQFRSKRIFSLLTNLNPDGVCDVSVSAKDDRRLWIFNANVKIPSLAQEEPKTAAESSKIVKSKASKSTLGSTLTVIKVSKPLQINQTPLVLATLKPSIETSASQSNVKRPPVELILSLGRRHFQVWSLERNKMRLKLMKADEKSSLFVESIISATCWMYLKETNQLVVGDSEGNITLLDLNLTNPQTLQNSPSKNLVNSLLSNSNSTDQTANYKINTAPLYRPNEDSDEKNASSKLAAKNQPGITCLALVSRNMFASADAACVLKFWRMRKLEKKDEESKSVSTCDQVSSVSLPADLGFICTIIISKYNRKPTQVEFYVVSTSNAILFGQTRFGDSENGNSWSLSVVYEGHESSVSSLVPDRTTKLTNNSPTNEQVAEYGDYFTCSPDCKICKWNDKNLIWKSMLPSACASMAIHPTGFVLAVGSADGTVYILDKFSGLLISYFPLTPVCINCLAYSRDGLLLAAGCSNGSIFILPVYERGLKYKKVSIFQSPHPVVSLQFSQDGRFLLTSVIHASYQELILWDLPNFRYMRDNVKLAADKIDWFNAICSSSEDVRATWENANLSLAAAADATGGESGLAPLSSRYLQSKRLSTGSTNSFTDSTTTVVNLSCHRLIGAKKNDSPASSSERGNFVIASDMRGYLRLFKYPAYDIQQGFYECRITSSPVNCCRFLTPKNKAARENVKFVSTSSDGSICLWAFALDDE